MLAKQIKMKQKKQKSGFLDMLLSTHGASLLGSMLPGKEVIRRGNEVT